MSDSITAVPTRDSLLDEALNWIVHLKAGAPTRADLDAFLQWRQQSNMHEEALRAAVKLYHLAGVAVKELADEEGAASVAPGLRPPACRVTS
ncbi:MAG: DUF4880 domain-containing protein [Bradyrhizobiaceae bacterium]|nr:DUF4880 domain-containing protein [Bradyrhizobiaceae bacterium]